MILIKKKYYYILIFTVLFLFQSTKILAASFLNRCPVSESSIFNSANNLYKEGKYEEAIEQYKKIENMRFESGNLFYNLGNCYFKTGRLGESILYYEKAKKLLPRDSDLKLNYEIAKSTVTGYVVPVRQPFFFRISNFLFQWLTVDELTIFISICFILCLVILLMRFFCPICYVYLKSVFVVLFVIFILACFSLFNKVSLIDKEAVILTAHAQIRFEPFKKANVFFEISQGSKVEVLQQKDKWVKIKRCDGKIGWVAEESLGFI